MALKLNKHEFYAGGLMMLIGLGTLFGSLEYKVGTLSRMGPGYFPMLLGIILIIISAAIIASPTHESEKAADDEGKILYRPWVCVVLGMVLFAVLGKYGGLVIATFAVVTVSALGDDANSLKTAALLGAIITIFAVGVFHYGLRMQIPLFTWG